MIFFIFCDQKRILLAESEFSLFSSKESFDGKSLLLKTLVGPVFQTLTRLDMTWHEIWLDFASLLDLEKLIFDLTLDLTCLRLLKELDP